MILFMKHASELRLWETEISVTLKAAMGESGSNTPYVLAEVDNDSSSLGQSSARQQSDDS